MADYKSEPSERAYAVATTPLSDLGQAEPAHVVHIHEVVAVPAVGYARSTVAIQRGKWSAGLCGCFDFCVPNCCMATCCPCISAAQIGSRIGYDYSTVLVVYAILMVADLVFYSMGAATIQGNVDSYYSDSYYYYYTTDVEYKLTVWGHLAYLVSVVMFIGYWQLRSKVRSTFDLPGSCLGDCCATFWCSCCALAQMATHVKSYKPGSCDFGPPDELAAYDE